MEFALRLIVQISYLSTKESQWLRFPREVGSKKPGLWMIKREHWGRRGIINSERLLVDSKAGKSQSRVRPISRKPNAHLRRFSFIWPDSDPRVEPLTDDFVENWPPIHIIIGSIRYWSEQFCRRINTGLLPLTLP